MNHLAVCAHRLFRFFSSTLSDIYNTTPSIYFFLLLCSSEDSRVLIVNGKLFLRACIVSIFILREQKSSDERCRRATFCISRVFEGESSIEEEIYAFEIKSFNFVLIGRLKSTHNES